MCEDPGFSAWPLERKCPICRKLFCITTIDRWAYKIGETCYCSYHCLTDARKKHPERTTEGPKKSRTYGSISKLNPKQKLEVVKSMIRAGKTNAEISRQTGIGYELVRYYRKKCGMGEEAD